MDIKQQIIIRYLNGDGQIKPSDLSKLKLNLVGSQTLQGAYAEAADKGEFYDIDNPYLEAAKEVLEKI